jgi:cobalt-zinc-cadmium efflux system outer membrane protein
MTRSTLPVVAAGLLAGCASVNPHPAFVDVQRKVTERTGQEARWIRSAQEADDATGMVRDLLTQELTADRAAQVALVNNRSLQATLTEIGVSQADFAQATRVSNPDFHSFVRFPDRPQDGTNVELSLFQDFLDILVQPLRKKLGAAQLEQTKLRVGDEMLRLMAETKTAYYTLVARRQLVSRLELIRDSTRLRRNSRGKQSREHQRPGAPQPRRRTTSPRSRSPGAGRGPRTASA